ncbi:MAG: radical SAM protein [Minisyncoccia bacterium]
MRICLVIPPSIILAKERTFPHLGILSVASVLKSNAHEVDIVDLSGVKNYTEALGAYVRANDTKVFGITATSPQMPPAVKLLKVVREMRGEETKVVLGGPHATLTNSSRKKELREGKHGRSARHFKELSQLFDTQVAGDGEFAMLRVLENPKLRLVDADDPKSALWLRKYELEGIPFPARELLDLSSYNYSIDGVEATTMLTQRGCPYNCGFCAGRNSPSLRILRATGTERTVAELRHLYELYGYRAVMLYDDEVNINREMIHLMESIARLGDELKVEWRLRGFVKANLFTREQARAMYLAGFREILVGFESGSPRILRNIKKQATLDQNSHCIEIAKSEGLRVKALISVGHPGESEETIRETEEWILKIHPESFDISRITVYPGSPYFDDGIEHPTTPGVWIYQVNGDRLYSEEVDFLQDFVYFKGRKGNLLGMDKFRTWTDFLTFEDLTNLKKETEDRLRQKLNQPYTTETPGIIYEHSMGMGLPETILRRK